MYCQHIAKAWNLFLESTYGGAPQLGLQSFDFTNGR